MLSGINQIKAMILAQVFSEPIVLYDTHGPHSGSIEH
jgi:hypothetical protein